MHGQLSERALKVDVTAAESTLAGLLEAIAGAFASESVTSD